MADVKYDRRQMNQFSTTNLLFKRWNLTQFLSSLKTLRINLKKKKLLVLGPWLLLFREALNYSTQIFVVFTSRRSFKVHYEYGTHAQSISHIVTWWFLPVCYTMWRNLVPVTKSETRISISVSLLYIFNIIIFIFLIRGQKNF